MNPITPTTAAIAHRTKAMTITIAADSARLSFFLVGGIESGYRRIRDHANSATSRKSNPKNATK
jgi:hypothetical protein